MIHEITQQGSVNVFCKELFKNYFRLWGPSIFHGYSVIRCEMTTGDTEANEHGWVPIKRYLRKQAEGRIGLAGWGLLTPRASEKAGVL